VEEERKTKGNVKPGPEGVVEDENKPGNVGKKLGIEIEAPVTTTVDVPISGTEGYTIVNGRNSVPPTPWVGWLGPGLVLTITSVSVTHQSVVG